MNESRNLNGKHAPDTNLNYSAWHVRSDGDVGGNDYVYDSYGRYNSISPSTEDDLTSNMIAWVISEAGEGNAGIVFSPIDSYGRIYLDRLFQIYQKMVKIAVLVQHLQRCVLCLPLWCRRLQLLRRQCRRQFLRISMRRTCHMRIEFLLFHQIIWSGHTTMHVNRSSYGDISPDTHDAASSCYIHSGGYGYRDDNQFYNSYGINRQNK